MRNRLLGPKITECDIDEASKGRVAAEMDDLLTFFHSGAGKPRDIIKKMRVVLESHCRSTYPGSFDTGDMLGTIVEKIRIGGSAHPAAAILDEVEQVNHYSPRPPSRGRFNQ